MEPSQSALPENHQTNQDRSPLNKNADEVVFFNVFENLKTVVSL